MIKVYHNDRFYLYRSDTEALKGCSLILAAVVNTDDLQGALHKTNRTGWSNNPEVFDTSDSSRATSVGDVLVKGREYYVVEDHGLKKLKTINGLIFLDPKINCPIYFVAPQEAEFRF